MFLFVRIVFCVFQTRGLSRVFVCRILRGQLQYHRFFFGCSCACYFAMVGIFTSTMFGRWELGTAGRELRCRRVCLWARFFLDALPTSGLLQVTSVV